MMQRFPIVLVLVVVGFARADWSVFEPIVEAHSPTAQDADWSDSISAFIYRRLEAARIKPPPAVRRRVWIRRLAYDLTGLPPGPNMVQEFLTDRRPDAIAMAEVVDRLLASPRYGERWARHWLDIVRYADTDGFAIDEERLWLWRYRDYVVRQFNEDRPFDRFICEQIAGDEMKLGERGRIALSYFRLGPWEADNMTAENRRQDYLNDVTANVGSAFLGLTIGCARCHDHKFDPIPQSDFYQLQAFFTPIQQTTLDTAFLSGEKSAALHRRHDAAIERRMRQIRELRDSLRDKLTKSKQLQSSEISDAQLDEAIEQKKAPLTDADVNKLKKLQTDKKTLTPERRFESKVVAIRNPNQDETAKETFLLIGGDPFDPDEKLLPGFLSEVPTWSSDLVKAASESGSKRRGRRSILARWLTAKENPITARVLANRIWHYHFGSGIVATPNDFGSNGSGPSHPELLDYLATQLIRNGWRLKPLHRQIVLSRVYRSSTLHPQAERNAEIDPENRLLWRAPLRRLESEVVRDAVLRVCGRLHNEMGGPGFYDSLPKGMGVSYPFFEWHASDEQQRRRRSIYMFQRRNLVHPLMETFDGADLNMSCERRGQSVTAPQALSLFNSQFVYENSTHLARQLATHEEQDTLRIEQLYWLALARSPTDQEQRFCLTFLEEKRMSYSKQAETAPPGSPTVLGFARLDSSCLEHQRIPLFGLTLP